MQSEVRFLASATWFPHDLKNYGRGSDSHAPRDLVQIETNQSAIPQGDIRNGARVYEQLGPHVIDGIVFDESGVSVCRE